MKGSTNSTACKWTKGKSALNLTLMGYGLDITDTSHIYLSLNVAPDVTSITFTGTIWGRTPTSDLYMFTNKTITFTESALGQWCVQAKIGTTTTTTAVIYQLTGTFTLS